MSKSIFSREVAAGLQDLENRYEVCRAIFLRARNINTQLHEDGDSPNPTVEALTDFTSGRIILTPRPEEARQI